ncbi:MAG TPA: hypothetical protein VHJ83_05270 [Micromonosporaceae bacterium]|jgi:hypothetical protein|nr:hypothetical protein [Micromonosporaceae bacterium]
MSDRSTELDTALERVIDAARRHLTAVKAAGGRTDDDQVWQSFVALNNLSAEYDDLLMDTFGEVTPWDVEPIDPQEADAQWGVGIGGVDGDEPPDARPMTVSVRQRRDYVIPSLAALLRVADAARRSVPDEGSAEPASDVGAAVAHLLEAGDGALGSLDIPELQPLGGVTLVCEVADPVDVAALVAGEHELSPFEVDSPDSVLRFVVERPYVPDGLQWDGR